MTLTGAPRHQAQGLPECTLKEELQTQKSREAHGLAAFLSIRVVPAVGFELTTYRLQGGCSTN